MKDFPNFMRRNGVFRFSVALFIVLEWCALRPIFATRTRRHLGDDRVLEKTTSSSFSQAVEATRTWSSEGGERVRDDFFAMRLKMLQVNRFTSLY